MTDKQTPPDWVLIEAAKRSRWFDTLTSDYLRATYLRDNVYRALCDMIWKREQPPVDPKLLCAREAVAHYHAESGFTPEAKDYRAGKYDAGTQVLTAVRAIELWEEGFGK